MNYDQCQKNGFVYRTEGPRALGKVTWHGREYGTRIGVGPRFVLLFVARRPLDAFADFHLHQLAEQSARAAK